MKKFSTEIRDALKRHGVHDAIFRGAQEPVHEAFGDTQVIVELSPFVVKFSRDRGQAFVEMSKGSIDVDSFVLEDAAVASGTLEMESYLARASYPELDDLVRLLVETLPAMRENSDSVSWPIFLSRVRKVTSERCTRMFGVPTDRPR